MKVANIFPIENQRHYKHEKFIMILAHLLQKGLYKPSNFNRPGQYVILDNGLYEGAKVSNNLLDLIALAETCGIKVDEIVIPDVMFDMQQTIQLFEENILTIRRWQHKYRFMFVAQAKTADEFNQVMNYIGRPAYMDLRLSVGIPKKCIIPRDSELAKNKYIQCHHPVHLLGIKNTFKELLGLNMYIRSCDSSQIAFMVKNGVDTDEVDIVNYVREGTDIDLEHDKLDNKKLKKLLAREGQAFEAYGILR